MSRITFFLLCILGFDRYRTKTINHVYFDNYCGGGVLKEEFVVVRNEVHRGELDTDFSENSCEQNNYVFDIDVFRHYVEVAKLIIPLLLGEVTCGLSMVYIFIRRGDCDLTTEVHFSDVR